MANQTQSAIYDCADPERVGYFDLVGKIEKRGRPRIPTAEYWRAYYTPKQREWRAARPRKQRSSRAKEPKR
jgi:hypothetical protein